MRRSAFLCVFLLAISFGLQASTQKAGAYNPGIQLRGFNIDLNLTEQDFENLDGLNVNAVRVAFASHPLFDDRGGLDSTAVTVLDSYVRYAKKYNILILVDIHTFPGNVKRYSGSTEDEYWRNTDLMQSLISSYAQLAERYKKESIIIGYDIVNEPAPIERVGYLEFLKKVSGTIVRISPDKIVLIQPRITIQPNGIPNGQRSNWNEITQLIDEKKIIGSLHYYDPGYFTHQGVRGFPADQRLPFLLRSEDGLNIYFKKTLARVLTYSGPVIVGEFSVSNYSPVDDAQLYMQTLIDLFEKNRWSWFYQSYKEADIWNPQMTLSKKGLAPDPASRKYLLLKEYFKLNERFQTSD
ncbi:Aryl-phospho-beta-D-glucosidase BglC, GH1 family [Pseudomonas grimontii]|uniref:Aryl-phospho-beta-D-glucosidase BglC, GH1 family n=1 Tax=Pseudomonas grimontii TaxID=129847 RepID=A0ABY0TND3_9PSED|nr:cellulase family glycosylhydrolase [Pseudomonas grimontii]SDR14383.1 Aryl-phospho-beta-D-glucosidase BglC, GH1 family [Pseudomonas grimontii]